MVKPGINIANKRMELVTVCRILKAKREVSAEMGKWILHCLLMIKLKDPEVEK